MDIVYQVTIADDVVLSVKEIADGIYCNLHTRKRKIIMQRFIVGMVQVYVVIAVRISVKIVPQIPGTTELKISI